MNDLDALFEKRSYDLHKWVKGHIPAHYKRLSIDRDRAKSLAVLGAKELLAHFDMKPYFTQSLIAGAILSGEFDDISIISPSQYGKSFLLGRIANLLAYLGNPVYITGGDTDTTTIIMDNVLSAMQDACHEMKEAILNKETQFDKLTTSMSKTRIAYPNGGFVAPMSLGDTFQGTKGNKMIGRAGYCIVDEAALASSDALAELGRGEFASDEGFTYPTIMISNPHQTGEFYDRMTEEDPSERHLIVWLDALTAVEEGRWTEEKVKNSKFAKRKEQRTKYLLCNLPDMGDSMFGELKTYKTDFDGYTQYFLGVDSAYKGKDDIDLCLISVNEEGKIHAEDITSVKKGEWQVGATSERIIDQIAHIVFKMGIPMVAVDIGQGIWLTEGLVKKGVNAVGVNFGSAPTPARVRARNYAAVWAANKRAEMYLDLQDLVENEGIEFSPSVKEKIKEALAFTTATIKTNGKYQIIEKSKIKAAIGKSPDEVDSLILAIHAAIMFTALPYC